MSTSETKKQGKRYEPHGRAVSGRSSEHGRYLERTKHSVKSEKTLPLIPLKVQVQRKRVRSNPDKQFALRPILNDRELEHATRLAEQLSERQERGALDKDQAGYLDVLLMLIERYEQEHHAFDAAMSVTERIQAIVESAGMTASQLGLLLGSSRALGGKLLRGEREPSKQHIRILSEHFHLNPRYFL